MTGRAGKISALLQSLGTGDVQPVLAEIDDIVMRLPSLGFLPRGACCSGRATAADGSSGLHLPPRVRGRARAHGMALYDVESQLGGTVYQGPGLAV